MSSENGGGRPTKWSADLQKRICELVEAGDRPHVAAGVYDVGRSTYFDWMAAGAQGVEPYAGFRTAITRAQDKYQSTARANIQRGDGKGVSFGPARAELEVLSRRFPKDWAPRVKHEIAESQNHFFEALSRVCSDAQTIQRVCETKDLSLVFERVCEELARLDGEDEAAGTPSEGTSGDDTALH